MREDKNLMANHIDLFVTDIRRKKTRCPGEKPICSHCARLRQNCYYGDDVSYHVNQRASRERTPMPRPSRVQETPIRSSSDVNLVSEEPSMSIKC